MQLQDIVFAVRKKLGETESTFNQLNNGQGTWDDSQIIGYANDCLGLISHSVRIEGSYSITLSTTQNTYALPTDCLEDGVRKLVYNAVGAYGPVPCIPINLDRFETLLLNPPQGSAVYSARYRYTVWAGNIMFAPYPGNNSDTATLFYYKTLPTLSLATDVPAFPARFHVALVHYALAQCQQAVSDSNLYQEAMQEFEMVVTQIRAELSRHSRDSNRVRRK